MSRRDPVKDTQNRITALLRLMTRLGTLHDELGEAMSAKLDAMRAAKIDHMRECNKKETSIIGRIAEQEGLRRRLMEEVGRGFGMSAPVARTLSARALADRLAEPNRARLQEVSSKLCTSIEGVRRINDLVGGISKQTLHHLTEVFNAAIAGNEPAGVYTNTGATESAGRLELFEAIG